MGSASYRCATRRPLSYHPREGREIAKSLLTPLSADLFSVVNAGADIEQLLLMTINDINDVPNAPRATTLTPKVADDNTLFLEGIRLLAALRERDGTELAFGTNEETDGASDPIPEGAVQGRDLLNAAQRRLCLSHQGEGPRDPAQAGERPRAQDPPGFVNSPEMAEVARIFKLKPGQNMYKIKSELTEEANERLHEPVEGSDTIYMNLRSVLQIMTFLSKGVCVPDEHVISGIAPDDARHRRPAFDWTRVTAGNFFVHAQKHRPHAPRWPSRTEVTGSTLPRTTSNRVRCWRFSRSSSHSRSRTAGALARCLRYRWAAGDLRTSGLPFS